jgi:hypothetical protein
MNAKQLKGLRAAGTAACRRMCAISVMTGIRAVVASCGTGAGNMRPPSGQALIDSKPISKHKDRIKGMRIVSKPWDATSNAPSGSTPRDAAPRESQGEGVGTGVFRRNTADD